MREAGSWFFLVVFLFANTISPNAQAADERDLEKLSFRIRSLEEQFKQVKAADEEILAQEEKILAEVERFRIWIHRSPGVVRQQ